MRTAHTPTLSAHRRTFSTWSLSVILVTASLPVPVSFAADSCAPKRARIEKNHVECKLSCEGRAETSQIRGRATDETGCEDRCRDRFEAAIDRLEARGRCEREEIDSVDFGSTGDEKTVMGIVPLPGGEIVAELIVVGDHAVFEGDILVDRVDEIERPAAASDLAAPRSAGRKMPNFRWPNGIVPFTVDSSLRDPVTGAADSRVVTAMFHWMANTPIVFTPRTTESDFVTFTRPMQNVCNSFVGRIGGQQAINIGNGCDTGAVIHEIGHAIGLWHEQTRADRDTHLAVNWANIRPEMAGNFKTYAERNVDGQDLDFFDFDSVMLYPAFIPDPSFVFDVNKPAMTRRDGSIYSAQRSGLSRGDISGVRYMYRKPGGSIVGLGGRCVGARENAISSNPPITVTGCKESPHQMWFPSNGKIAGLDGKVISQLDFSPSSSVFLMHPRVIAGALVLDASQRMNLTDTTVRTPGGKCLGTGRSSGRAKLLKCPTASGAAAKRTWTYTDSGELRSGDGRCLEVRGMASGAPAFDASCNGSAGQKWTFGPGGQLRAVGGGCLEVAGFADRVGTKLKVSTCTGGSNQTWSLRGEIRAANGNCLAVPWDAVEGSLVAVSGCTADRNQIFEYFP